jgi:hypothetical protein
MNLQTEALAKQAAEYAIEFATQDQELYIPKLMEKFAELIVKECMQVCADRGAHHDGLYSAWADDCSKRIGRHFGVEQGGW